MSDDIEVVVGRIGKPHGLRGEVTVESAPTSPSAVRRGAALRAEPPPGSAAGPRR